MRKPIRMAVLVGVLGMPFSNVVDAAVIHVPANQPTIQAGINAAVSGVDEVVVAPGTYFEKINFNGKAINLHSASGNPSDTIIDGTGLNDSVVLCISGEGVGTVLEGFTITGGTAGHPVGAQSRGGGMFNEDSSPTVTNCTFSGNGGFIQGGGMYNHFGTAPTVTNCTFSGNSGIDGGGMNNDQGGSPTVTNCTFSGNTATQHGGGMYNKNGSNPTVTNCTFSGNTSLSNGGGMHNTNFSNPTVTNCTFSGNTASTFGGGMFGSGSSIPIVTNCTYSRNSAGSNGGGRYISVNTNNATMTNCIFSGNSPNEIFIIGGGAPTISYTNIQGGLPAGAIDGGGNIDVDPFFIDADGVDNTPGTPDDDLRLAAVSPCTDAGNNAAPGLTGITTDLDGNPRFFDDTVVVDTGNGTAPIVDMGPYERQVDSSPSTINVPADFATIQAAINASTEIGDEIIVAPGTYPEVIDFLGKAINLHSASGNPADTIIDGTGLSDSVVLCVSGEQAGTILEGFTITGGTGNTVVFGTPVGGGMFNNGSNPTVTNCSFNGNAAANGGGMYNHSSSPTITNCAFSGNSATNNGGGMWNTGRPAVANCTFSGNTAISGNGGGMFNNSSTPTMTNCIFWGNSDAGGMDESAQIHVDSGVPTVDYSNIQGGWTGAGGTGNLNADPLFLDADGADNTVGTVDDDLRLSTGSPCIDSADSSANHGPISDLGGVDRTVDDPSTVDTGTGVVTYLDMGAHEVQAAPAPPLCLGDMNQDGAINGLDTQLFIAALLAGAVCP